MIVRKSFTNQQLKKNAKVESKVKTHKFLWSIAIPCVKWGSEYLKHLLGKATIYNFWNKKSFSYENKNVKSKDFLSGMIIIILDF